MPDLISREAAFAECQRIATEAYIYGTPQFAMGANACRDAIRAIPAAPVHDYRIGKTGAWCFDCGITYGDHGFPDLVIPHADWRQISPSGDEGGMLCPSCICARLGRRGISTTSSFRSGPLSKFLEPAPVSLADAARVLLVAIYKDANDPLMSAVGFIVTVPSPVMPSA